MKLLVNATAGDEELKCFVALAETGTAFSVGASDPKYAGCGPQLVVGGADDAVIFSANAVCRYIAAAQQTLAVDDLAIDEWVEWESHVLAPFVKTVKKQGDKADKAALLTQLTALLEAKEEARANKAEPLQFLFGSDLTLADIVAGVTLRAALTLLPATGGEAAVVAKFRSYVAQLFARPGFAKGLSLLASGGKAKTSLDDKIARGLTYHNVLWIVETIFGEAVKAAFPGLEDLPAVEVTRTNAKNAQFGDYQCNSAMAIFTKLKGTPNAARSPRDVANAIIAAVPENDVLDRLSVAGAGFINAFLTKEFVTTRLRMVLREGVKASPVPTKKIVIDFSSPNIAKDMHVGHLRSTIIGEAMCRILEFQGHDVSRINHVGDWGTQFGMLICHLTEAYPNWETECPDITDLTKLYKEAKLRFDEDEDFHRRSKEQVVKLQGGDERARKAWTALCDISRREFQKVYDRLDVKLEEMGESFYNPIIPDVIDSLKAKGITEDSNGALVIFTKAVKQPFMLQKSDGSYLYDTTDIAALWYRLHKIKAGWVIVYTDYTQSDHFKLLFEVGKMSGIYDPKIHRVDHVGFGTVNDESGKRFKTRSGEVVRLVDLLDEARNRMATQLLERIESGQTSLPKEEVAAAAEKIGYGAVKYFDLRQSPTSNYVFSFDRMLSTNGDTAVYLLFAYARLSSIIRRSGVDVDALIAQEENLMQPVHATEQALALELLQLQDVIQFINRDLSSNRLCQYLYSVAERVQTFVTSCRVIGSEEQSSRLLLCQATLKVMAQCFKLLAIEPLDQI
ncbi:TPA: hypothetical protein N0F65_010372 [Lagenidium giganteum]|uniref:arginine--tRNA ligase n=1 Tax=Lagenidium giganteum TaxID=4803 RepID=A0AAV2YJW0_9STRA|nr:TPA: hypothetical protein N0F65_010372 [Lagenidium giganteum]